jgi:hypothetical protein
MKPNDRTRQARNILTKGMERGLTMKLKNLAEGIILQSIEDLWDNEHREESLGFFRGKDFRTCAELAGMSLTDQVGLLNMVKGVINQNGNGQPATRPLSVQSDKKRSGYMGETAVSVH